MTFRKDNQYTYMQDMSFWRGIPAGVDFDVKSVDKNKYMLTAYGYGQHGSGASYGNGAIHVFARTKYQRSRLAAYQKSSAGTGT
jgi:hypothetical protein